VKLDRVLVPLDGSPLAERALRTALALLRERPSATVILMRAAQGATPGPWTDPTPVVLVPANARHLPGASAPAIVPHRETSRV
jgi:nucleotide-binding universal stress UspA family protein